jgi:hypothetical protein
VSVLAMLASATLDLPTGATVVCAFGLTLLVLGGIVKLMGWSGHLSSAALGSPGRVRGARR